MVICCSEHKRIPDFDIIRIAHGGSQCDKAAYSHKQQLLQRLSWISTESTLKLDGKFLPEPVSQSMQLVLFRRNLTHLPKTCDE